MSLSTHRVEVVPVVLEPHPNADTLSVVKVYGYVVVVRSVDWEGRTIGAYIPPDSVVPATPDFAFLGEARRIRTRRFRGVMSQGMLHPAPEGAQVGDDVAEALGIVHYEPALQVGTDTEAEAAPVPTTKYDIDSGYRYAAQFVPGEEIVATEKIHGANATYLFHNGRMWAKSHSNWKKPDPRNLWWQCAAQNPWIDEWCRAYPDMLLCGEVFGQVQDLKYGAGKGQYFFRAFDIGRLDGTFLDRRAFEADMPQSERVCPVVYRGPFDLDKMRALADGPSLIPGANHIREGIVVAPVVERYDMRAGRCKFKFVSPAYLERQK